MKAQKYSDQVNKHVMGIMEQFGRKVKTARKDRRMTVDELAPQLGISKGALSTIENGKRNLRLNTILDLGEKLGIKCAFVFKLSGR